MAGAKGAGARGGKGKGKKRARAAAAADAPGAEEEHARAARRAKGARGERGMERELARLATAYLSLQRVQRAVPPRTRRGSAELRTFSVQSRRVDLYPRISAYVKSSLSEGSAEGRRRACDALRRLEAYELFSTPLPEELGGVKAYQGDGDVVEVHPIKRRVVVDLTGGPDSGNASGRRPSRAREATVEGASEEALGEAAAARARIANPEPVDTVVAEGREAEEEKRREHERTLGRKRQRRCRAKKAASAPPKPRKSQEERPLKQLGRGEECVGIAVHLASEHELPQAGASVVAEFARTVGDFYPPGTLLRTHNDGAGGAPRGRYYTVGCRKHLGTEPPPPRQGSELGPYVPLAKVRGTQECTQWHRRVAVKAVTALREAGRILDRQWYRSHMKATEACLPLFNLHSAPKVAMLASFEDWARERHTDNNDGEGQVFSLFLSRAALDAESAAMEKHGCKRRRGAERAPPEVSYPDLGRWFEYDGRVIALKHRMVLRFDPRRPHARASPPEDDDTDDIINVALLDVGREAAQRDRDRANEASLARLLAHFGRVG